MISPHSPYSINHSPHPTHLTSTHLYSSLTSFTSSHLIYLNHLTSSHLTSPHLTTPNLTYLATSHLTSNLLCSSHSPNLTSLTSSHLSHLISPQSPHIISHHLTSSNITSLHLTSLILISLTLLTPKLSFNARTSKRGSKYDAGMDLFSAETKDTVHE